MLYLIKSMKNEFTTEIGIQCSLFANEQQLAENSLRSL